MFRRRRRLVRFARKEHTALLTDVDAPPPLSHVMPALWEHYVRKGTALLEFLSFALIVHVGRAIETTLLAVK